LFFIIARFFGGIGIGLASGLSPMYIAEISPAETRGRLVSLNQMTIVLGILGAQIVNWLIAQPIPSDFGTNEIAQSWNGQMAWRCMFGATAVPSALFMLMVLFIPESPRWLVMRRNISAAHNVLSKIGGMEYADSQLKTIEENLKSANIEKGLSTLMGKPYRKVLILGVVIAVFQQWCGTNVFLIMRRKYYKQLVMKLGIYYSILS